MLLSIGPQGLQGEIGPQGEQGIQGLEVIFVNLICELLICNDSILSIQGTSWSTRVTR
jgi:hypothetical protein